MRNFLLAAVAIVLAAPVPAVAALDCSRATSNAEKMVCSNGRLALAEERMAYAFREAIRRGADPSMLMQSQRRWTTEIRDACNEVECMLRAYEDRTAELENP
ncbi:MAG TPA: lysozyme inhibitor LprI family protein [Burkholderiales bacterium]|jgi:uncharacterized protein|nr:lysozyme inhibitor LprI family protein [Burkholderiales bacterium]